MAGDDTEIAPVVRVHRSRLAFALAVTLAAVPVLVLDNFPATAEGTQEIEISAGPAEDDEVEEPSLIQISPTSTTAAPSTTTTTTAVVVEDPTTSTTTAAPSTTTTQAPAPASITTQAPAPAPAPAGDPNDPATWDRLAQCEAAGNWAADTGNGYYGGLQFSVTTWEAYGGTGYPHEASKATQIDIGKRLQAARGWDAWPSCARELGYR